MNTSQVSHQREWLYHTPLDRDVGAADLLTRHSEGGEQPTEESKHRGQAVPYQSHHLPLLALPQLLPSFSSARETGDQSPRVRATLRGAGSPAMS